MCGWHLWVHFAHIHAAPSLSFAISWEIKDRKIERNKRDDYTRNQCHKSKLAKMTQSSLLHSEENICSHPTLQYERHFQFGKSAFKMSASAFCQTVDEYFGS